MTSAFGDCAQWRFIVHNGQHSTFTVTYTIMQNIAWFVINRNIFLVYSKPEPDWSSMTIFTTTPMENVWHTPKKVRSVLTLTSVTSLQMYSECSLNFRFTLWAWANGKERSDTNISWLCLMDQNTNVCTECFISLPPFANRKLPPCHFSRTWFSWTRVRQSPFSRVSDLGQFTQHGCTLFLAEIV